MEDRDWWRENSKLEQEKLDALSKILPPDLVEAYEIRESNIALNLKYHLEGLDISEEEYKALYKLRKAEQETRNASQAEREHYSQESRQAYNEAKQLLGPRFEETRWNGVPEFRALKNIAERTGTAPGVASEIWQMKDAARSAENELRQSQLPPEEIARRTAQVQAELRREVETKLGPRGFQMYRRAASWLAE